VDLVRGDRPAVAFPAVATLDHYRSQLFGRHPAVSVILQDHR
jgi:hypothetical protein